MEPVYALSLAIEQRIIPKDKHVLKVRNFMKVKVNQVPPAQHWVKTWTVTARTHDSSSSSNRKTSFSARRSIAIKTWNRSSQSRPQQQQQQPSPRLQQQQTSETLRGATASRSTTRTGTQICSSTYRMILSCISPIGCAAQI